MAEPDQPKKETVRINLPVPPPTKPPEPSVKPRETVRIQLPTRETGGPPSPSSPQSAPEDLSSTNFFPQPKPPAAPGPVSASVRPPLIPPSVGPKKETVRLPPEALQSAQKKTQPLMAMPNVIPPSVGPKKETARIPPEPLRSSQKKTQPLMAMPNVIPQNPAIAVAPVEKSSMLLYWMLLGISALILIIEIWTYFS
jgi:hypothetical protein